MSRPSPDQPAHASALSIDEHLFGQFANLTTGT